MKFHILRGTKASEKPGDISAEDALFLFWETVRVAQSSRADVAVEQATRTKLVFSLVGKERTTYTIEWKKSDRKAKTLLVGVSYWVRTNVRHCTYEAVDFLTALTP